MAVGNLKSAYVRVAIVVSLYWIVSIVTVFVNKILLCNINFDAPLFIAWYQCLTTVFICHIMKFLNRHFPNQINFPETDPISFDNMKKVLPLSVMFMIMIATNNLCLKYVSVAFYYIGRSLTTIFNVSLTYLILGERTSCRSVGFCVIIILGFIMGVDQENLAGSLSVYGTVFGILGSLALSLYSIYTKRVLPFINYEVWLLSYYNNLYSIVIFIPLILINGEITEILNYEHIFDYYFWFIMTVGGVCGFSIGFLTTLQIKVTSPLTHNISGTAKACAQTVLASYWYQESKSFLWWFSNMIVLFGSAGYARTKQLDMEKKHLSASMNKNEAV